jgi:hypothetical protein
MNKNKLNINNIKKIRNEIIKIIKTIDEKERGLIDINNHNNDLIETYKFFMEQLINEYHKVCKKIYN